MFVVDASVVVHILTSRERDDIFQLIIAGETAAPHLLDLEVVQGFRRAAPLLTRDRALSRAHGHTATIQYID